MQKNKNTEPPIEETVNLINKNQQHDWNVYEKVVLENFLPSSKQQACNSLYTITDFELKIPKRKYMNKFEETEKIVHFRYNVLKFFPQNFTKEISFSKEPSVSVIRHTDVRKLFQVKILNASTNFNPKKSLERYIGSWEERMNDLNFYIEVSLFFGGELITEPQFTKLKKEVIFKNIFYFFIFYFLFLFFYFLIFNFLIFLIFLFFLFTEIFFFFCC